MINRANLDFNLIEFNKKLLGKKNITYLNLKN